MVRARFRESEDRWIAAPDQTRLGTDRWCRPILFEAQPLKACSRWRHMCEDERFIVGYRVQNYCFGMAKFSHFRLPAPVLFILETRRALASWKYWELGT